MTTEKKQCLKCLEYKASKHNFYISHYEWFADGYIPYCKKCIKEKVDINNTASIIEVLQAMNKPFIMHIWQKIVKDSDREPFGLYLKDINLNHKYKDFSDSEYQDFKSSHSNSNSINDDNVTDELLDKWGYGYTDEEIKNFERKYKALKDNYKAKTAMHTEGLLTYIRFRVKEEMSTAKGDVKVAKEWGALASKAAQDAKINPSQLSKSDLSDGLDTFGQLTRMVEENVDIIPLLPTFKERPHDKPDFTMWCYINYIRDMKSLPLAEYEEIYKFYENRKKEYENRFDFLNDESEETDDEGDE